MRWTPAALLLSMLAAAPIRASEEDIAPWTSVTFKCRPTNEVPETTVTVETEGTGNNFRLRLVRIANKEIDVKFPREAIADLAGPMPETAQLLSAVSRRGGPPCLYFAIGLADPNPRDGERTFVHIKVEFGKVTGRVKKIVGPKGIRYEDLPIRPIS